MIPKIGFAVISSVNVTNRLKLRASILFRTLHLSRRVGWDEPTRSQHLMHDVVGITYAPTCIVITLHESPVGIKLLLLAREPINEQVVGYGSFVKKKQNEIHQVMADYQSGKFGRIPAFI